MKKIILTMAIVAGSIGMSFAGEVNVNDRVLSAFKKEFSAAREIKWTESTAYYQVSFVYNDRYVSAYYSPEGELKALTRHLSPADLPMALQSDLKKNHGEYWISDLFEVANDNGTSYYITLEDAENSIVLKATNGRDWNAYKKVKKS